MRSTITSWVALLLVAVLVAACRLGARESNRTGLDNSAAGSGGRGGSSSGTGGMSGSGAAGDDDSGLSGQGGSSDGGASGQGSGGDDGGMAGAGSDHDSGTAGAGASSGGSSGMAGTGSDDDSGTAGAGASGIGGSTNGLADCMHDDVPSYSGHDYFFCSNYTSWTVARDTCADASASLVAIDDADENGFLIAHFGPHPSWWIGASDQTTPDEWRWVDGGDNDGATFCTGIPCSSVGGLYVNFASDQPSTIGDESCGALQSAGTWSDEYCVVAKPFICEVE